MKKTYILEGLDCANCALKIEKALNKEEAVHEATVNYATLKCEIDYKEYSEENEKKIIELIQDLEDEVTVIKKEEKHSHEHHDHHHCDCEHEHHHEHHHEHSHEHHDHCGCGHEHSHEHEACGTAHSQRPQKGKNKWIIQGLDCANCALKIEDALNALPQVKNASLNFTTQVLLFDLAEGVDENQAKELMKKTILSMEDVTIQEDKAEVKKEKKINQRIVQIVLGLIFLVIALISENVILYGIAYLLVGTAVILKAFKNIKRGEIFDENFLMMIATIAAFIIGEYAEAVAVMVFYQLGEYFQDRAVARSRQSIAELMNIRSDVAHLITSEGEKNVDPESVAIDSIILVKPGERVPLDGVVIEGNSSLDTSALTGEALPRDIAENDEILAGCINLNGLVKVKVTKIASESTVSRILEMVENASSKKAVTEQKMTKFARIYTPIVVILAVLLAIVPNFFPTGIEWSEWVRRAATFLVISCPCALVLSIPLGYFAGIGAASKKGILIKGGNYLEILNEIDTVVFDKTGTLTNGTFNVVNIEAEDKEKCLELAAAAESYSTHPIALSILKEYNKPIQKEEISGIEEIAGKGIKAVYNNDVLLVGNWKLMEMYQVQGNPKKGVGTMVYVAQNNKYVGVIEIADTLKPTTKTALAQLRKQGIKKLIMLSGDIEETANYVGKELGLDEVHAQLLPTDKVKELEKMLKDEKNGKVAYVGDGINDAPVLARSDLGIAMGGLGSEAAIEAADVVLMKDDLSALNDGLKIAKFTQKIMNQNIVFILAVKIGILLLSLFGHANMWMGVFADVGVSVLAVLNAMRILSTK